MAIWINIQIYEADIPTSIIVYKLEAKCDFVSFAPATTVLVYDYNYMYTTYQTALQWVTI